MEDRTEYITDALEMMGTGYDHPSVTIEPPRRTMERRPRGEFQEVISPAWVKFSTAFKSELPDISGRALKTWIFIALSVNYEGKAFPAINTIAKGTGASHQTVIDAIKELEEMGLLTVNRDNGRHNLYKLSDDYIKIGRGEPVKILDGLRDTDIEKQPTSLISPPNQSSGLESNKKNQNKLDLVDGILKYTLPTVTLKSAVTTCFPFNVNWESKFAREWLEWAHGENITPEQIKQAAETWRSDKAFNWQQPTLKLIFEKWPALMAAGGQLSNDYSGGKGFSI